MSIDRPRFGVLDVAMGRRFTAAVLVLGLTACADYPRDCEGTLDTIRTNHIIRVGLAASPGIDHPVLDRLTAQLGRATGSRLLVTSGPEEGLLAKLERGDLDLVVGDFVEDSPWLDDVALIEPLTSRAAGDRKIGLTLIARNGENAWIGLLERTVRDVRGDK